MNSPARPWPWIAHDNGEWRLYSSEKDIIADPLGFEVTLGDGTKIGNAQMALEKVGRERGVDPKLGNGVVYTTVFKPVNGVKISQKMMKYEERPFLTVRLIIENTGAQPFSIARIAPIHVAPGAMTGFKADVQVHTHTLAARGGFAVADMTHAPVMTRFFDTGRNVMFMLGIFPEGGADASCAFKHDGAGWVGEGVDVYAPALALGPGAKVESDWCASGTCRRNRWRRTPSTVVAGHVHSQGDGYQGAGVVGDHGAGRVV